MREKLGAMTAVGKGMPASFLDVDRFRKLLTFSSYPNPDLNKDGEIQASFNRLATMAVFNPADERSYSGMAENAERAYGLCCELKFLF